MPLPLLLPIIGGFAAGSGLAAYFLSGDKVEGNQTNNYGTLNVDGNTALLLAVAGVSLIVFSPQIKKALS